MGERHAFGLVAIATLAASPAWSQGNTIGAALPQAPIGHRQPTVKDLPPDVARDERPADASRGEQQSAPLPEKNARALAGSPKLLLLDEPGAGLNTVEKSELVQLLKRLKGHGLTILVIDHDMNLVEQVADRITVFNFGRRIADGPPAEVLRNPEVMAAYLGNGKTHVAP